MGGHCTRCEDLEEQLAYYRRLAGQAADNSRVAKVQTEHGVSPQQAKILIALAGAPGRTLTTDHLATVTGRGEDVVSADSIVKVQVHRIRRKLGEGYITTVWGRGFKLGPDGLAAAEREGWAA